MPVSARGVQNRQPRPALRIEPPRCNQSQSALPGRGAIFLVDIQQLGDRRLIDAGQRRRCSGLPHPPKPMGQGIANAGDALGAETGDLLEPPVVSRRLQFFQRVDAKQFVQLPRSLLPDAGNGRDQLDRIGLATQAVQHGQPAMQKDVANGMGDGRSHTRNLFKTRQTFPLENRGDRFMERPQHLRGMDISVHTEAIRVLGGKNARHLLQPAGDVLILGHELQNTVAPVEAAPLPDKAKWQTLLLPWQDTVPAAQSRSGQSPASRRAPLARFFDSKSATPSSCSLNESSSPALEMTVVLSHSLMTPGSIRFAALMPHAPILVPAVAGPRAGAARTTAAMRDVAGRLGGHSIDTVVVISPHSPRRRNAFGLWSGSVLAGSLGQFGARDASIELPNDLEFAPVLSKAAAKRGVELWSIQPGLLDHGAVVPLWFLAEGGWNGRTVILSLNHPGEGGLDELGAALREAAERCGRRVAVIASGDMSHRLTRDAPGGHHPGGAQFDRALINGLRTASYKSLREFNETLQQDAGEDALDSTRIALAAAGWKADGHEVLSYEGPFGVGYGVAVLFQRPHETPPEVTATTEGQCLPAIARRSVFAALTGHAVSHDTPLSNYLSRPGAVFVTMRTVEGRLRGCVGSLAPSRPNIVQETWHYARIAAFNDPRFAPVALDELDRLRFEVSVLHTFQTVQSTAELDPRRFGVIVSASDGRRGLLLPAIPEIQTVGAQLRHVRGKAGIAVHEPVEMQRFQVDKFEETGVSTQPARPWSQN